MSTDLVVTYSKIMNLQNVILLIGRPLHHFVFLGNSSASDNITVYNKMFTGWVCHLVFTTLDFFYRNAR